MQLNIEQVLGKYKNGPINMLFGAGVSKDYPTNAPIWNEMQTSFLMAIFDRMEAEGWPSAFEFPKHRSECQTFQIRPETFWCEMQNILGMRTVQTVFDVFKTRTPNSNHRAIANLLDRGFIKSAITTNFDEYVEQVLSADVPVVVPESPKFQELLENGSQYIKLHGTLRTPSSLSYTLEHYDKLEKRNLPILQEVLSGHALIIAGYSGYDSDILPTLIRMADDLPIVAVIRYPGANIDQPIFKAAGENDNWHIVEAGCGELFDVLLGDEKCQTDDTKSQEELISDDNHGYRLATAQIPLPFCAAALMFAYDLMGDRECSCWYALLAHDASLDDRYSSSLSNTKNIDLNVLLGMTLARYAHPLYSTMFDIAETLAKFNSDLSESMWIYLARESATSRFRYIQRRNNPVDPTIKQFKP